MKHSKPGQVYTVDCDVVNTGIPYSDAFTVKSVYCLTYVSKKECRLRISGCVKYKKTVWGIVKCKYTIIFIFIKKLFRVYNHFLFSF